MTDERVHLLCALWRGIRAQHHGVARILARQHGADLQALRQHHRHVLAAVHRQVDLVAEQRILDLLDEQPLAADLRQRRLGEPVARRLDDDDLRAHAGLLTQQRGDGVGLEERQLAAARADSQHARRLV